MKIQMSNNKRVVLAVLLFFFSIIVFGVIIAPAGFSIAEAGKEMTYVRSVGGNSIAEAYYQLHGEVYVGFGNVIACIGVVFCLVGCFISGWILKPVITSNKSKIETFTNDVKGRVTRATQELTKPATHYNTANDATKKCSNCGSQLEDDSAFCTKCGTPIAAHTDEQTEKQQTEQRLCPSCGKPVSESSAFCTKCGHQM